MQYFTIWREQLNWNNNFFQILFSLTVVTIFFAVKLTKAELPKWFDWILVAFVGFHVVIHVMLSVSLLLASKCCCCWLLAYNMERIIQKKCGFDGFLWGFGNFTSMQLQRIAALKPFQYFHQNMRKIKMSSRLKSRTCCIMKICSEFHICMTIFQNMYISTIELQNFLSKSLLSAVIQFLDNNDFTANILFLNNFKWSNSLKVFLCKYSPFPRYI